METIYESKTLKNAVESLMKAWKLNNRQVSLKAEIHPSYFSRGVKGQASFSQAQIFRLAEVFQLNEVQIQYFILLWSFQEAQKRSEKEYFSNAIKKIQDQKQKVAQRIHAKILSPEEKRTQLENYYSDTLTALIHMYLTIPKFKAKPELICDQLHISENRLLKELKKLSEFQLIDYRDGKVLRIDDSIHLPEESPLSIANHINWRLRTIQNLQSGESQESDYHLSVAFSADESTKQELRKILQDLVVKAQKAVGSCDEPQQIYHLMMDLY